MDIIISHSNLDFDGLASMVAASKLYPRAKMILPENLSKPVAEYLSLYKDILPLYRQKEISFKDIKRVIVVDTNSMERLGEFIEKIPPSAVKIVWDHHPVSADSIVTAYRYIENVGAATTLLVEKIKEKKIQLNSFEATLMTLGIYSDTGSLVYTSTLPRDLEAAAYLLRQEANLGVVSRYLEKPLDSMQQEILQDMLENIKTIDLRGINVLMSHHRRKEYAGGINLIAHKIMELTGADALFLAVKMAGKIFILGRSNNESLKIDGIIKYFGGGGHPGAAAAVIKNRDLKEIMRTLEEKIKEQVEPVVTAGQIMSSPVKTILPDTSVKDAASIMLRNGHTGLPVVDNGRLVGIISRRDVDKALNHKLGHAPVKAYMSKNVISVETDTPLNEVENKMIKHDIGRLPVLQNGQLVGIVTRSDVLSRIHGEKIKRNTVTKDCVLKKSDIRKKMRASLSKDVYDLLKIIGRLAEESNTDVYLVGGIVRDLLLGRKNRDLDLVVEGDGVAFSEKLAGYLGKEATSHKKFGTSTIELDEGINIDVATSRSEYYAYPAALPQVERARLKQDLSRRDFTINAMAIKLNSNSFGTLIDYFCGYSDLQKGLIRVLHNLSFVEDPTRILRAVRFENRLEFMIEPFTYQLAEQAAEELKKVSKPRLGMELRELLCEERADKNIIRLQEMGALSFITDDLADKNVYKKLYETVRKCRTRGIEIKAYLLYLGALALESQVAFNRLYEMGLYKEEIALLNRLKYIDELEKIMRNLPQKPGDIYRILKDLQSEICLLVPVVKGLDLETEKVLVYLQNIQQMNIFLDGRKLKKMGFKPGPLFKEILEELKAAKLNEEITGGESAEYEWIKKYLSETGR